MGVRVTETSFTNRMKSISAIPDEYVALPAQIAVEHAITENGRTFIPGGLCVTNARTLDGRATGLIPVKTNEEKFDGVVFTDTVVSVGEKTITVPVMVQGYAKYAALEKVAGKVPESGTDAILVVK